MAENTIYNPFSRGATITIPKGTIVRSLNPSKGVHIVGRTMQIKVNLNLDGWIDVYNDRKHGRGYVVLPQVSWAGSGGYWHYAQVTAEVCAANGIDMPAIPTLDRAYDPVDVEPSYDEDYCDQWRFNAARVAA